MLVTRPVESQKRASLRLPSSSKGNPSSKSTKHTLTECMACSERKSSSKLLLVLCLKAQSVHVRTSPWHEPDVIFLCFPGNSKAGCIAQKPLFLRYVSEHLESQLSLNCQQAKHHRGPHHDGGGHLESNRCIILLPVIFLIYDFWLRKEISSYSSHFRYLVDIWLNFDLCR